MKTFKKIAAYGITPTLLLIAVYAMAGGFYTMQVEGINETTETWQGTECIGKESQKPECNLPFTLGRSPTFSYLYIPSTGTDRLTAYFTNTVTKIPISCSERFVNSPTVSAVVSVNQSKNTYGCNITFQQ